MSGIQPQSLTDKKLLSAALLMFEPDVGMPIGFQKELIRRLAAHVEASATRIEDRQPDPRQLSLF
jgi:hypothetical protein